MYKWLYISVQLSILSCYNYLRSEIICISVCFCQLRMGTERVTAWRAAGRQLHDITNTSRLRARSSLLPDPRNSSSLPLLAQCLVSTAYCLSLSPVVREQESSPSRYILSTNQTNYSSIV